MPRKRKPDDEILRILRRDPGLTLEQLKERTGHSKHSVEDALSRLRLLGHIIPMDGGGAKPYKWHPTEGKTNGEGS